MKILGENSLSSKVIIGLDVLFAIISVIDLIVLSIIAKVIRHIILIENVQDNLLDLTVLSMVIITGIIALFIIYQFIKIFKNLKSNVLFSNENAKMLNAVSNSCFVMGVLYFFITLFIFFIMRELIYNIMAFLLMLAIIFAVGGIGIKILNEIYKKAIEYKEENDLTV